ncbi:MAG: hypothetical protein JWR70_1811, partial [Modestobacter sp.]|nr:hypothetical protein [Modestobacter sp.]
MPAVVFVLSSLVFLAGAVAVLVPKVTEAPAGPGGRDVGAACAATSMGAPGAGTTTDPVSTQPAPVAPTGLPVPPAG